MTGFLGDTGADELECAGVFDSVGDVVPVDDVPEHCDVVGPSILVLEVVGVFPGVDDEERYSAVADVAWVVVDPFDVEACADPLPR